MECAKETNLLVLAAVVVVSDDAGVVATAQVGSSSALGVDERVGTAILGILSDAHDDSKVELSEVWWW